MVVGIYCFDFVWFSGFVLRKIFDVLWECYRLLVVFDMFDTNSRGRKREDGLRKEIECCSTTENISFYDLVDVSSRSYILPSK